MESADQEAERIDNVLESQTLRLKARREQAVVERMEAEARQAQINEVRARVELAVMLSKQGVMPVWDSQGRMRVMKAPADYDPLADCGELLPGECLNRLGQQQPGTDQ
jgi:rhamnose utilization protein RhaD (predicted bifunctional aldolase and dehydrogenase)